MRGQSPAPSGASFHITHREGATLLLYSWPEIVLGAIIVLFVLYVGLAVVRWVLSFFRPSIYKEQAMSRDLQGFLLGFSHAMIVVQIRTIEELERLAGPQGRVIRGRIRGDLEEAAEKMEYAPEMTDAFRRGFKAGIQRFFDDGE